MMIVNDNIDIKQIVDSKNYIVGTTQNKQVPYFN